ncbi:unnamed protein product [Prorocentrum cordatum]|nr:unnamed protein product [Polarella glacialis]
MGMNGKLPNGGGHGEIGYHLALLLRSRSVQVTLIQDSAAKMNTPPFNSYGDLEAAGVTVKYADLAGGGLAAALEGVSPCTHVFDNQNVCPRDVQNAVAAWSPKNYSYVSSGGMYKVVGDYAMSESNPVKPDNKQLANENAAKALGLPLTAFRPQYIYGPKTNKREYIDWFLHRILGDVPIPLPKTCSEDGSLKTTLTNAKGILQCEVRGTRQFGPSCGVRGWGDIPRALMEACQALAFGLAGSSAVCVQGQSDWALQAGTTDVVLFSQRELDRVTGSGPSSRVAFVRSHGPQPSSPSPPPQPRPRGGPAALGRRARAPDARGPMPERPPAAARPPRRGRPRRARRGAASRPAAAAAPAAALLAAAARALAAPAAPAGLGAPPAAPPAGPRAAASSRRGRRAARRGGRAAPAAAAVGPRRGAAAGAAAAGGGCVAAGLRLGAAGPAAGPGGGAGPRRPGRVLRGLRAHLEVLFASRLPAHAVERLPVRAGGRGRPGAGVAVHRGDHLLFLSSDRVQAAAYEDGLGERHLPGHRLCRAGRGVQNHILAAVGAAAAVCAVQLRLRVDAGELQGFHPCHDVWLRSRHHSGRVPGYSGQVGWGRGRPALVCVCWQHCRHGGPSEGGDGRGAGCGQEVRRERARRLHCRKAVSRYF